MKSTRCVSYPQRYNKNYKSLSADDVFRHTIIYVQNRMRSITTSNTMLDLDPASNPKNTMNLHERVKLKMIAQTIEVLID